MNNLIEQIKSEWQSMTPWRRAGEILQFALTLVIIILVWGAM